MAAKVPDMIKRDLDCMEEMLLTFAAKSSTDQTGSLEVARIVEMRADLVQKFGGEMQQQESLSWWIRSAEWGKADSKERSISLRAYRRRRDAPCLLRRTCRVVSSGRCGPPIHAVQQERR